MKVIKDLTLLTLFTAVFMAVIIEKTIYELHSLRHVMAPSTFVILWQFGLLKRSSDGDVVTLPETTYRGKRGGKRNK